MRADGKRDEETHIVKQSGPKMRRMMRMLMMIMVLLMMIVMMMTILMMIVTPQWR